MSDTSNLFGSGFFFPGASQNMSKELRQRIALAMLAQKRKAPSTFGEGLSAIGDSLGEMGTMRRLAAEENAAFTGGNAKADELLGVTSPGAGAPPPGQPPMAAAPQPQDQTPVPPTVQEGGPPVPPRPVFRPNAPVRAAAAPTMPPPDGTPGNTGATTFAPPFQPTPAQRDAAAGGPVPPDQQQSYEPGAAQRMPSVPARPSVADFGQKLALAPTDPNASPLDNMPWPHGNVGAPPQPGTPPVMAQGGDDPRRAIALSMLRQGQPGQPQFPAFAPAAPPPAAPPSPEPPPPDRGIAAAPPAAPIQKMPPPPPPAAPPPSAAPPPAGPQPGYVSQPLQPVIAPMPEPMSAQEAKLRDAIARDPEGPSGQLTRRLGPVLQTLEANRAAINQRNIEKYKVDIAAEAARIQKIEEQKTGAAKDIAEVANTQARTRKEGVIEEPDNKMILGPDGIARPIQIDSGPGSPREPPLPKNEAQLKALKHHEQMVDAEKVIGDGKALRGINSATGAKVPLAGPWLQSDAYRRERAAAERWVINKLRPESGAQFSDAEIDREVKGYFPQPSDDAKTVADKNAARRLANEGMLESSGREGKRYMEWKTARAAEAETAKQKDISEAKQWLNDHPNDPRAAKVRQRLGL